MIRIAKHRDIPKIRDLMKSEPGFWQDTWREDVLERGLNSADGLAFVWEENRQILGFICAHDLGFRAYLSELIVASPARFKGIGRNLVRHIERELENRGCNILISDVWKDVEGFYKSLGWSEPDVLLLRRKLATLANQQGAGEGRG